MAMSRHMKRLTVPRSWPLERKTVKWAMKPVPGPYREKFAMPIALVLRDMLKICDTTMEARAIIRSGSVLVDNSVVKGPKFPVGIMSTLSIPSMNLNRIMLVDKRGKLSLVDVEESKVRTKLCRIEGKSTLKKGKTQLNLHDGRCIVLEIDENDKVGDTLKIEVPGQRIVKRYPLKEGSFALVTGGRHVGQVAKVLGVSEGTHSSPLIVDLEGFSTVKGHVLVVGDIAPEVAV
jgi:small subunit ribosomal protein S4e